MIITAAFSSDARIDVAEVKRALGVLVDPEHGVELRALPSKRFFIGAGADLEKLETEAVKLGDEAGLYFTLNPIPANLRRWAKKENVIKRRWFLLDFDRKKTEEDKDLSATETEKEACRAIAETVIDWLREQGWPIPLFIDSGNGFHALYRIDLLNTDETQDLLREVIYALAEKFDTHGVEIDKSVHNASRISKLPGSFVRRGLASKERPHRPALLLHVPGEIGILTAEQIAAVTEALKQPEKPPAPEINGHVPKRSSIMTVRAGGTGDGHAYAARALEYEVLRVKMASPGGRNNALNRAGFSMAQLAAGGCILWNQCQNDLEFAARLVGLGDAEIKSTLGSAYEAGSKQPRTPPDRNGVHKKTAGTGSGEGQAAGAVYEWQFTLDGEVLAEGTPDALTEGQDEENRAAGPEVFPIYTLPGLMLAHFPEPKYVVEGLLSEGLNILAGSPKTGKSMLALNLALTIAGGGSALKEIPVQAGDVLYLALEDTARRIQSRARRMLKGIDCEASARFKVATRWPTQDQGGLKMLDLWCKRSSNPTLVVIDVFGKFRPEIRSGGSQYEQDYRHLSAVKDYLDRRGCNSLVLMHTRKAPSEDELHMVSGTQGLAGVADGLLVLTRTRSENDAQIFVTGRDVGEVKLSIEFDPETFTWKSMGPSKGRAESKVKLAILAEFKANPGGAWTPVEMALRTAEDKGGTALESWKTTVRGTMLRMESEGVIARRGEGSKYIWPAPAKPKFDEGVM